MTDANRENQQAALPSKEYLTDEQLAAMSNTDISRLLRRRSGDKDFHWRVREAVLNEAARRIEATHSETRAVPCYCGTNCHALVQPLYAPYFCRRTRCPKGRAGCVGTWLCDECSAAAPALKASVRDVINDVARTAAASIANRRSEGGEGPTLEINLPPLNGAGGQT